MNPEKDIDPAEMVRRLEAFAEAYPIGMFAEPTKEERDWLHNEKPGLQDRIAASMGRHLSKFFAEAARFISTYAGGGEPVAEVSEMQVRSDLLNAYAKVGTYAKLAEEIGVSEEFARQMCHGHRPITGKTLTYLGYHQQPRRYRSTALAQAAEPGQQPVALPEGVEVGEFKPCVIIDNEAGVTEFVFEDAAYVAEPVIPGVHHWIDKHVAMSDGRLVGGKVWFASPLPAPAEAGVVTDADALQQFTAYFVKNYPGPDTIIHDPSWHAPRIFRAAKAALSSVPVPTDEAEVERAWAVFGNVPRDKPLADHITAALNELADIAKGERARVSALEADIVRLCDMIDAMGDAANLNMGDDLVAEVRRVRASKKGGV